jgi:hypothetical protein
VRAVLSRAEHYRHFTRSDRALRYRDLSDTAHRSATQYRDFTFPRRKSGALPWASECASVPEDEPGD